MKVAIIKKSGNFFEAEKYHPCLDPDLDRTAFKLLISHPILKNLISRHDRYCSNFTHVTAKNQTTFNSSSSRLEDLRNMQIL
jgi:hypothetical protein